MLTHLSGIWTKLILTLQRDRLPQQSKSRAEAVLIQFIKSSSFHHLLLLKSRGKFALGPSLIISVSGDREAVGEDDLFILSCPGTCQPISANLERLRMGSKEKRKVRTRENGNWVQSNRRRALVPPKSLQTLLPPWLLSIPHSSRGSLKIAKGFERAEFDTAQKRGSECWAGGEL